MFQDRLIDAVLHLELDRPARLNALTLAGAEALLARVQAALADDAVRALLFTGAGRAFCAGKDRDDPPTARFVDVLRALGTALLDSPKPVVAGVHGWVVGAGLELMLAADVVVAARSARFQLPETALGLLGTGGVTALLPAAVGLPRAKALLMLGEPFGAADAERWGLVAQLADDEALPAAALALARRLAAAAPAAIGPSKALLHQAALGDVHAALAREAAAHRGGGV